MQDEAGAGYTVSRPTPMSTHENVNFIDGDESWEYDIKHSADETTRLSGFSDAQLGDFLSRPLKIKEYSWTPNASNMFFSFNPWKEFFGNADVREKINRYRNLRCNLRLKVIVNGNSFYYGRALMSYNPYLVDDDVTKNRAFFEQDLVQASQKPHILLDPTTSQGGEMLLPFIWPENYLKITGSNWEDQMGLITVHDFDVLRHANGGEDPITVSFFAWTEDLTLSVPTTSQAQSGSSDRPLDEFGFPKPYLPQAGGSGKKKKGPTKKGNNQSTNDEFKSDGLISKPASAISSAANALSMIPMLTPYAKATSMVASKIGQVARVFGYSRPQVMEDTRNYVPRYAGNMANSDAPETLVKLSLDSKNELSIDSRVMGLGGQDELAISAIAKRPSFWRQFDWPESATADTLLTSMTVTPAYNRVLEADPVEEIHPTALAFAASPFECWQGSIKFRFIVVASEYHRGRLRLVYNPEPNPSGAIPFNQTYSTIIDITEDRDFEYEVKWADIRAWNKTIDLKTASTLPLASDLNPASGGGDTDNGTLSVYVVNELATPSTTEADIKIQVWVSGGDDFAVSVPTTKGISELSPFKQQSQIAPEVMATSTDESNDPMCSTQVASYGATIPDDNQYLVYQGERIASFRDLLRRYQYHYSYFPAGLADGFRRIAIDISDFPFYRGWDPDGPDAGIDSGGSGSSYTFCTMTLINYLTPAFALRRGGMRHKAMWSSNDQSYSLVSGMMMVARHDTQGTSNSWASYPMDSTNKGELRKQLQKTMLPSLGGFHVTPLAVNPVLEYETPFYTVGQRFVPARKLDVYFTEELSHELSIDVDKAASETSQRIDKYVSIAEDFNLGLFVGAPILYAYEDPST